MDDEQLKTLLLLSAVERSGSFAAAARELNTTRARVSRLIGQAERRLNLRLCHRTTRQVVLTEAARNLVQAVNYHLDSIQAAVASLSDDESQLRGRIRVSVSHAFGRIFVTPIVTEFLRAHPQVSLEYHMSDKLEQLAGQGIDIAIRIGALRDSNIVARPLGRITPLLVGAPGLLPDASRFPTADLADLAGLPGIAFRPISAIGPRAWLLEKDNKQISYEVPYPVAELNSIEGVADLVSAGVGIAAVPDYLIDEALKAGRVINLLREHRCIGPEVHLCYSSRALIPLRVRRLIEALMAGISRQLQR